MKKLYGIFFIIFAVLVCTITFVDLSHPLRIVILENFSEESYYYSVGAAEANTMIQNELDNRTGLFKKNIEVTMQDCGNAIDPEKTVLDLKKLKPDVVITTLTSTKLKPIQPLLKKAKISCIAVGSTSIDLKESDGYMCRLFPDNAVEVSALLNYCSKEKLNKNIIFVHSNSNEVFANYIKQNLINNNCNVIDEYEWDQTKLKYSIKNKNMAENKAQSVIIAASPKDTAFIVQELRKDGITLPCYGFSWSGDSKIINYGGREIDGFTFVSPIDISYDEQDKDEVMKKFQKSYGKKSGILVQGVYEAYEMSKNILSSAYAHKVSFRDEMLSTKGNININGHYIKIDKYGGNISKNEFILRIKDGKIIKVGAEHEE